MSRLVDPIFENVSPGLLTVSVLRTAWREAQQRPVDALHKFVKWYDDELSNHDGEYPQADTGCIECTEGCVPNDRNTGLCAYHNAKSVLRKIDRGLKGTNEDLV